MTTLALLCSAHAPAGVLPAVHDLAQRCLWRKLSSLPAVHDLAQRRPVAQAFQLAGRAA